MKKIGLIVVGGALAVVGSGVVAGDGQVSWIAVSTGLVLVLLGLTEASARSRRP